METDVGGNKLPRDLVSLITSGTWSGVYTFFSEDKKLKGSVRLHHSIDLMRLHTREVHELMDGIGEEGMRRGYSIGSSTEPDNTGDSDFCSVNISEIIVVGSVGVEGVLCLLYKPGVTSPIYVSDFSGYEGKGFFVIARSAKEFLENAVPEIE